MPRMLRNLYISADLTAKDVLSIGAAFGTAPVALDNPVVLIPAADATGPTDKAVFAENVQLNVDVPIGTAPVTSISTAELSAQSSDPALEEFLQDSLLLTLLAGDSNTVLFRH